MTVVDTSRDFSIPLMCRVKPCTRCGHGASMNRSCGAWVCDTCGNHEGLARCYCGWSASGGDGRTELLNLGENIEGDDE
jgi:hypothetical protein